MAKDWHDDLRQRYPWAARTPISVGDGWKDLVTETFAKLDEAIKAVPVQEPDLGFECTDVKEKYGTLRIDIFPYVESVEVVCTDAEDRSEHVCDECGRAGCIREGGWVVVRCDEHVGGRRPATTS